MSSQPAGRDEDQVLSGADLPLLLKVQAPVEYLGVGSFLSPHRREIAEPGSMHRTARKLAALFDAILPQVPNLVAAYGTRASEILKNHHVNPAGAEHHLGPFSPFAGVDASSLWAAATSGATSVALHLLACFLARAFADPTHSVSVWVEIILERQKEIANSHDGSTATSSEASEPISREEIRDWDASARAWLRTADVAMKKSHTQFSSMLKDGNISVSSGDGLYADVIRAWTNAMLTLERLLGGRPHTVTDGAVLLGISAWHIYPNILLLDTQLTEVGFFDSLFPASCFLTIDSADGGDDTTCRTPSVVSKGIHWLDVLAHHDLDGSSVEAIGTIDYRVNIDELYLIALGSLLGAWNAPRSEIEPSLNWFIALWSSVQSARSPLPKLRWIENIALAASRLLEAVGPTKKDYEQLLNFGYNQGRNFLASPSQQEDCLPWFGLRHWHILNSLGGQTAGECGIRYLRHLAKVMELRYDEAIITQISHENLSIGKKEFHQYTTAIKVPLGEHEGPIDSDEEEPGDSSPDDDGTVPDLVPDEDPVQTARKGKKKAQSSTQPRYHKLWEGTFTLHDEYSISKVIEEPKKLDKYSFHKNPLSMGEQLQSPLHCYRTSDCFGGNVLADCQAYLGYSLDIFPNSPVNFSKMFGDSTGALRLWMTTEAATTPEKLEEALRGLQTGKSGKLVSLDSSIALLTSGKVCPESLWQYLEGPDPYQPEVLIKPFLELCRRERHLCEPIITSLRSLVVAQSIYEGLDGATIASSIVERGISDAKWAELYHSNATVSRSVVFGCIAMFDSGNLNLDTERLEDVFALSSGNSIYAASRILSDPSTEIADHAVSHIVGNIGRRGVSLLVPHSTKPLAKPSGEIDNAIKYKPFNGCREDKFPETSLRLDITGREIPVSSGVGGINDHQAFFIESSIGVHDAGRWITDLDVPRLLSWEANQHNVSVARVVCSIHSPESRAKALEKFVAVDSWDDVQGTPTAIGLVRTYKNWPARLAVSVTLTQNRGSDEETKMEIDGQVEKVVANVAVLDHGDELCWTCVHRRLKRRVKMTNDTPTFLIA